jgi:hypothetical protein
MKWLAGIVEAANYEFSIALRRDAPQDPKVRKRDRDRAEALRLVGAPTPSLRDRAVDLARKVGEVRTRDLTNAGVPVLLVPDVRGGSACEGRLRTVSSRGEPQ